MEGRMGERSRALKVYDLEQRRLIDAEIRAAPSSLERQAKREEAVSSPMPPSRSPTLPTLHNPAFVGKTGNGDWDGMLAEMDTKRRPDARRGGSPRHPRRHDRDLRERQRARVRAAPGTAGPGRWRGQYFTALEGGIRVPFMIRWPARYRRGG
jgi:arylsulfatase